MLYHFVEKLGNHNLYQPIETLGRRAKRLRYGRLVVLRITSILSGNFSGIKMLGCVFEGIKKSWMCFFEA